MNQLILIGWTSVQWINEQILYVFMYFFQWKTKTNGKAANMCLTFMCLCIRPLESSRQLGLQNMVKPRHLVKGVLFATCAKCNRILPAL